MERRVPGQIGAPPVDDRLRHGEDSGEEELLLQHGVHHAAAGKPQPERLQVVRGPLAHGHQVGQSRFSLQPSGRYLFA